MRWRQRGMAQDFSWEKPVHEYVRVYERVIQELQEPGGSFVHDVVDGCRTE